MQQQPVRALAVVDRELLAAVKLVQVPIDSTVRRDDKAVVVNASEWQDVTQHANPAPRTRSR